MNGYEKSDTNRSLASLPLPIKGFPKKSQEQYLVTGQLKIAFASSWKLERGHFSEEKYKIQSEACKCIAFAMCSKNPDYAPAAWHLHFGNFGTKM